MGFFCTVGTSAFRRFGVVFLALLVFLTCHQAMAVDITMNFMPDWSENPDIDPNGSKLVTMMSSLATYYEDIFEQQDGELIVWFRWDDGIGTLAQYSSYPANGTHQFEGLIRVNPNKLWYIDETPFDNSEYNMYQVLYDDLSSSDQASRFNGNVPDLLEVEYVGYRNSSNPETLNTCDLWSVLMHEMGHGMGMISPQNNNDIGDGDYDFNKALVWGQTMAANCHTKVEDGETVVDGNHLKANALMDPATGYGWRHLPAMIDILSMVDGAEWDINTIDLKRQDFYSDSASADYNTTINWAGNKIPDADDETFIRHGGAVTLSDDAVAKDVTISKGSSITLAGHELTYMGKTNVGVSSTDIGTLDIDTGIFSAKYLTIAANSSVSMGGGLLFCDVGTVNQNASLQGNGTILLRQGLQLGGNFHAQGGDLVIQAAPGKSPTLDLDYTSSSQIVAESGNIVFNVPINESGAVTMYVSNGNAITSNYPWTLSRSGKLYLNSTTAPTRIAGSTLTVSGLITSTGNYSQVDCPVVLTDESEVLFTNSVLTFLNNTQIQADAYLHGTGRLVANSSLLCHDGASLGIDVCATDQLTLGTTTGNVLFAKNLELTSTASLTMDLRRNSLSQIVSDHLSVNGITNLGGATLTLNLLDGLTLVAGEQFDLFDWNGTLQGTFANIVEPAGYDFDWNDLYTTGIVTVLDAVNTLPGDANGDGVVDGSDATILAGHWQNTDATWEMGDFNDDHVVDGSDATILAGYWQQSDGSATAIPEPSMIALLCLSLTVLGILARKK